MAKEKELLQFVNAPIAEDLKDDAKEYFGTTPEYYSNVGLYINTDGTILDGSGEKLGNTNGRKYGQRSVDHREVAHIFSGSISGNDAMIAYMNEGNIRWKPEAPGFELIKEPTKEQYEILERLIRKINDDIFVDIDNNWGEVIWSKEYEQRDRLNIIKDIKQYFSKGLTEDTRTQFISKSKNVDHYKHNVRGKNRFERKRFSKIANQVKSYNTIDMNKFFKQDLLEVTIPVVGETDNYEVTLQVDGVVAEIARNIKNSNNKFEYKTVVQAITKVFNTANIKVKCQCDDFKYRYRHNLIINNNSVEGTDKDPGPGKTGMTAAMKGQGCKHILLVLANQDWIMKVSSCIKNYITYMDENKHQLFMKAIFPRLYSFDQTTAEENNIIPEDVDLETDKGIITIINDWAKERGKYKKGSNKNPVSGIGGRKKKEEEPKEEKAKTK